MRVSMLTFSTIAIVTSLTVAARVNYYGSQICTGKPIPSIAAPHVWITMESDVTDRDADRVRQDYRFVAEYTRGRVTPVFVEGDDDAIVVLLSYRFPGTGGSELYNGHALTVINPRYSSPDTILDELGHQLQNHICVPKMPGDILNLTNLYMDTSNELFWLRIRYGFTSIRAINLARLDDQKLLPEPQAIGR
jgi:hypothetical protein